MPQRIEVKQLWKFYGDFPALRNVTLGVEEGSCCALLGRNGAGKTTLLRILAGLSPFQRGNVRLFGNTPRDEASRRRLGFLGHGIGVYEDLTARENLDFFARICELKNSRAAADRWLERVGLARAAGMPVRQFSRGMRQRLALARTFLNAPRILLLDEPFTSLDDRAIAIFHELLLEARQAGATMLLSTHQIPEALAVSTHVAVMDNGNLRYTGERTDEMLRDPARLYRMEAQLGVA